ncbi:MAG: nuclear transport factor 2 family protein [Phycisphaerae bacterium]
MKFTSDSISNVARDRVFARGGVLTLLVIGVIATCGTTVYVAEDTDAEKELRAFVDRYKNTIEADDMEAIRDLYVADKRFAWFTDGRLLYKTRDDIVDSFNGFAASGMTFSTELTDVRETPLGDDFATIDMSFATKANVREGQGFSYAGAMTMVLERSADKKWRIISGHSSTPGGPPAADRN